MTNTFQIVDGDVVISTATGQPYMVEEKEKLRQDVRQLLAQDTDEDGFGASLDRIVGTVPSDPTLTRADIAQGIRDSVRVLQALQDEFQSGYRTPEERLLEIVNLTVNQIRQGTQLSKTGFLFRLDVLSVAGGQSVAVSGTIVT